MNTVNEYHAKLDKIIARRSFQRVKKAKLAPFYSDDFFPEGPIHLNVRDDRGAIHSFVFCEPSMAQLVVDGSDHLSYWSYPHEAFVLLDRVSPERILETAERFIEELKGQKE